MERRGEKREGMYALQFPLHPPIPQDSDQFSPQIQICSRCPPRSPDGKKMAAITPAKGQSRQVTVNFPQIIHPISLRFLSFFLLLTERILFFQKRVAPKSLEVISLLIYGLCESHIACDQKIENVTLKHVQTFSSVRNDFSCDFHFTCGLSFGWLEKETYNFPCLP